MPSIGASTPAAPTSMLEFEDFNAWCARCFPWVTRGMVRLRPELLNTLLTAWRQEQNDRYRNAERLTQASESRQRANLAHVQAREKPKPTDVQKEKLDTDALGEDRKGKESPSRMGQRQAYTVHMRTVSADDVTIVRVANSGTVIELDDGSKWLIDDAYRVETSLWLPTEEVIVFETVVNGIALHSLMNTDQDSEVYAEPLR